MPDLASRLQMGSAVNATDLPNETLFDAANNGERSSRACLLEVCLLTGLSFFATVITVFVFGTHINTWLSALSLSVAAR